MKQKPISMPMPHKPKRILLPAPEDLSSEELEQRQQAEEDAPEAYRQAHFLILYSRDEESSLVADLNGKTVIHHVGPLGEVSALLNAMQNAKWQNERVYPESFHELSDEEFMDEGMAALDETMSGESLPPADPETIRAALESLRGSFLEELIKPPKKKG
jgi:hypothetical protein